jgi:hypothetical protein
MSQAAHKHLRSLHTCNRRSVAADPEGAEPKMEEPMALEFSICELRWERYQQVSKDPHAREWLQFQAARGLAANTLDAYGCDLDAYFLGHPEARASASKARGCFMGGTHWGLARNRESRRREAAGRRN